MDNLRGNFADDAVAADDDRNRDLGEEETGRESPPLAIGTDERRMQVRAYNHWASLLDNRNFPSIEDLDPENLPDFGPHSVLLDFTGGIENPAIQFLGAKLGEECGGDGPIRSLDDVPARSLLSRITDHYMQILANQAPIGFEAEFVNQRGSTILYRGILLPYSSNDETIDFIFGVINWKELADQQTTDELLLEIDQALEAKPEMLRNDDPLTEWADGPVETDRVELPETDDDVALAAESEDDDANILDLVSPLDAQDDGILDLVIPADAGTDDGLAWPAPALNAGDEAPAGAVDSTDDREPLAAFGTFADYTPLPLSSAETTYLPAGPVTLETGSLAPADAAKDSSDSDMALADWLASARELALAAQGSEDRTRQTLYDAIGRAYDFSLAATQAPDEFTELVADSGLTVQDRAPMTPVVKLVFGGDYDKTRLTEYASALSHAHRLGLGRGSLAGFLAAAQGGLKGVVTAERRLRREESGKAQEVRDTPRESLARKLRRLETTPLDEVSGEGHEFTLLVARRLPSGEVVLLGEVADDVALLERAARTLLI